MMINAWHVVVVVNVVVVVVVVVVVTESCAPYIPKLSNSFTDRCSDKDSIIVLNVECHCHRGE